MASICNDPNGLKRILFVDADGKRKVVRLGRVDDDDAKDIKNYIEAILTSRITGKLDRITATWLDGLDDTLHGRLAAVGLVESRASVTLAEYLDEYIEKCRNGHTLKGSKPMKPSSIDKLRDTQKKLNEHFPAGTLLRSITPAQATAWRKWLQGKLSEASVKTYSGNAKTMIGAAVGTILEENPFEKLEAGSTESAYKRYVTPAEIARIIDNCPNNEWKLLFGLARYAGLRVPSETHLLTAGSIDWDRWRATVKSPKTERYKTHAQRVVPIDARLQPLLQARYDDMEPGEAKLVTITGQGNMSRWIEKILAAAGVEVWDRFWQTLRASCEIEWAKEYPQFAVSRWIGHSITVSGKHYANMVPDDLFDKAAQKAAQQPPEMGCDVRKPVRVKPHSDANSSNELLEVTGGGGNRTRVP